MRTLVALIATLVVFVWAGSWSPWAHSFSTGVHEGILRYVLGDLMEENALITVMEGSKNSDWYHMQDPEQHFDNAKNPAEICKHWAKGLNSYLNQVVELSAPKGEEKRELSDRAGALEAFGRATHAIADFYSHTNWIELSVKSIHEEPLPTAPLLKDTCNANDFPTKLQSGYFNLVDVPDFCPIGGPPSGYEYCHSQLAKDEPEGHGNKKPTPYWDHTYHELAVNLAREATRQTWEAVHDRIVAKYSKDKATDAECLFMKLAWGGGRSCHRLWRMKGSLTGVWHTISTSGDLKWEANFQGFDIRFRWSPVRYPGPLARVVKAAYVYAPIEGFFSVNGQGNFHEVESHPGLFIHTCDARWSLRSASGQIAGWIQVVPDPEPAGLELAPTDPYIKADTVSCRTEPTWIKPSEGEFYSYPGMSSMCWMNVDLHGGPQRVECQYTNTGPEGLTEVKQWLEVDVQLDTEP